MKVLFAGGGTGGHINPAIAIANAVIKNEPNSEVLFVGTKIGLEETLVKKAGYNIKFINIEGFIRKVSFHNVLVMGKVATGIIKSMGIIKKFKPDIVVGTGGYVSGPVLMAAKFLKIPTLIHEQNAIAGVTSKLLAKYVDRICVAFNDRNILGYKEKTFVTGNPIRSSFKEVSKENSKKRLGLDDGLPFVLCVSGSLGSQMLSEYMTEFIKKTYKENEYHLLLVTGDLYIDDVKDELKRCNIDLKNSKIYIKNYIDNVELYLSAADLIISRAGAIFLSEIAYLGKPSILIPSPNVAENHQEKNADAIVELGAAIKISEKDLTEENLYNEINNLIKDTGRLEEMAIKSKQNGILDADVKIYNVMVDLLKK